MDFADILEKIKIYLHQILRRWWVVFLTTVVVAILTLVFAIKKEVIYTSKTVFHPQTAATPDMSDPLSFIFSGGSTLSGNQEMQGILESTRLCEMVCGDTILWHGKPMNIARLYLQINPEQFSFAGWVGKKLNNFAALFKEKQGEGEEYIPTLKDTAVMVASGLKKEIFVEENEKGMIEFSLSSKNPPFLKAVSYKYIEKLTAYYKANRTQKSQDNYHFLVKRTDSVKRELMGTINRGAQYIDQNQFRLLASQEVPIKKAEGEMTILKEMYAQLVTMREAALNQLLQDTPVLQVLDYPKPPYENNKAKLFIFLIIGLVLGLVLGILISISSLLKKEIQMYFNEMLKKSNKVE